MKNKEAEVDELNIDLADYTGEIAEVAYAYWETRGCLDGHDVEDWLMAEKEVARRHTLRPDKEERRAAISHAA